MKSWFWVRWFANRSIFLKVMIIFTIAAILVNLVVSMIFHAASAVPRGRFHQFVKGCAQFMVEGLGNPPNLVVAEEYAQRMGLDIAYQGPEQRWSTGVPLKELEPIEFSRFHSNQAIRYGRAGDRPVLVVDQEAGRFLLIPQFRVDDRDVYWVIAGMVLILSLILFGLYLWIKRLFRQVNVLHQAVEQVGNGDLTIRVPVPNQDELGQLTSGFNEMTSKLGASLHSQRQLLLNVSHELRSPLTRMKLGLEFVGDEKLQTRLGQDLDKMESMIARLLESARYQQANLQKTWGEGDLVQLVEQVFEEHESSRSRLSLHTELPSHRLRMDEEAVRMALRNLVENALKYSELAVELYLREENGFQMIEVRDQGEGIPAEDLQFIFDPFYRVDKSRNQKTGGFGLGLSLCKDVIKAHGGEIWVESEPRKITRFIVRLPKGL